MSEEKKSYYSELCDEILGTAKKNKSNVICAWCKKELPNNPLLPFGLVSHGICEECKEKLDGEIDKEPEQ